MDSILWLIAVIVFVAAEAATTALISIWFAVGAAVALIVSLFTASLPLQFLVFALVSAVTLAIMVPMLASRRKGKKTPVTTPRLPTLRAGPLVTGAWCCRPFCPAKSAGSVWMGWTGRPGRRKRCPRGAAARCFPPKAMC